MMPARINSCAGEVICNWPAADWQSISSSGTAGQTCQQLHMNCGIGLNTNLANCPTLFTDACRLLGGYRLSPHRAVILRCISYLTERLKPSLRNLMSP